MSNDFLGCRFLSQMSYTDYWILVRSAVDWDVRAVHCRRVHQERTKWAWDVSFFARYVPQVA